MVIFCSLPVPRSLALTCRMPLASMSKVTSICGTPRGAGGMSVRWNLPMVLLSRASWRSPWRTWISTPGWLSEAVEKISDLRVGNGGVALDELGEHAAQRLDAERQRRHVEQQHVLDLALEHAALDGRADGDHFVRVHALVRGLVDQLVRGLHHLGHAGHAADQHQLIDLVGGDAGVAAGSSSPARWCARTDRRRAAPSWRGSASC